MRLSLQRGRRRLAELAGMPATTPMPTKNPGDLLTAALWNTYVRDNIDKLLTRGHRVLTVAQFAALTGLEGTKGSVPPDEVYLEVDSTNGIQWHLAYESGETTYKWRCIGGPALVSYVVTAEATTSATYAALTTAGPAIALPRAGDYDTAISAGINAAAQVAPLMSYDIGGTGAVDTDALETLSSGGNIVAGARPQRKTALTAVTLTMKYKAPGSVSTTFRYRYMAVTPVRIS